MKKALLFDLGNTLVHYYERSESPVIIEQAVAEVQSLLEGKSLFRISQETLWQAVREESYESQDYRVRPLEKRLRRIFQLGDLAGADDDSLDMAMCRSFMKPIFARGHCYEDTLPILRDLRLKGFVVAIVSNTPWGSPAELWHEEIERLGLGDHVDLVVFCTDVGWRKPARQIFEFVLEKLQMQPQHCVFVGDHPKWDVMGPRNAGIEAICIDRSGVVNGMEEDSIRSLQELWDRLLS